MKRHSFVVFLLAFSLLMLGAGPAMAQGGPVRGAIFTTLGDGSAVNANHFESKCAVHLDGGPGPNAPAHAAGLADGEYYFQVTDPSGKQLLSQDPVSNRSFKVAGGVIVEYTGRGGAVHPTGIDRDHSELGAITIRLANATCPDDFLDSPNNGGAYKVWATPTIDFAGDPTKVDNACGNGCFHGFLPSKSKTDNFKAKSGTATFCLTVQKELQQPDGTFVRAANWQINVTDQLSVTNTYFTDATGQLSVCGLAQGTYQVAESTDPTPDSQFGYTVVSRVVNGTAYPPDSVWGFTWAPGNLAPVILFQNKPAIGPQ
jgi:hypothetical protein